MRILHDYLRMQLIKLIYNMINRKLISGNRVRGHDHHIIGADMHFSMHTACHTGKCRHGFSLRACCYKYSLLIRIVLQIFNINQGSLRNMNIFQLGSYGNNIHHGTAFHNYLPLVFYRGINNLLHAVNIRSKGRHNNTAVLMLRKNHIKGSSHAPLRHSKAGFFRICGVGHHS